MEKITVTEYVVFHAPDASKIVSDGMTIRAALKEIREYGRDAFGDIGTAEVMLSDGSKIDISLQPASDGGYLMSSQKIARQIWDGADYKTVRYYAW